MVKDMTGLKFGKLTVLRRGENHVTYKGVQYAQWWCMCDCQLDLPKKERQEVLVRGSYLRCGDTKSCGCLKDEVLKTINKKSNEYNLQNDYGIGYLANGNKFYFDLEDYDKIKDYWWYEDIGGYVVTNNSQQRLAMHRLLMNVTDKTIYIDHISHNKKDNRKQNLRIADTSKNQMNKRILPNNTSGVTGVYWDKRNNKWRAQIVNKGKTYNLGRYTEKEDAIKARKDAEEKMFREWSYENSQRIAKEVDDNG